MTDQPRISDEDLARYLRQDSWGAQHDVIMDGWKDLRDAREKIQRLEKDLRQAGGSSR
jgi:hypothetical protein